MSHADRNNVRVGPGQYESRIGFFEKTAELTGMSSKDKFFVQDNGHINMRTQHYSGVNKGATQIQLNRQKAFEVPGPGTYETTAPVYVTNGMTRHPSPHKISGAVINPITVVQAVAPGRAAAAVSNPSLQKMSVPSIPSRFLTPIINANPGQTEDNEVCKMSRLIDDPSRLGPGSYQLNED